MRAGAGRGGRHAGPLVFGGVVGHQLPRALRAAEHELATGDTSRSPPTGSTADFSTGLDPRRARAAAGGADPREHARGHRRRAGRRRSAAVAAQR